MKYANGASSPSFSLKTEYGIRERVHFLGRISDEEKSKLYSIAKLSFSASVKEGWGLSNMESQSFGCPVVGYDVPGVRDSCLNMMINAHVSWVTPLIWILNWEEH